MCVDLLLYHINSNVFEKLKILQNLTLTFAIKIAAAAALMNISKEIN